MNADGEMRSFAFDCFQDGLLLAWNNTKNFKTVLELVARLHCVWLCSWSDDCFIGPLRRFVLYHFLMQSVRREVDFFFIFLTQIEEP